MSMSVAERTLLIESIQQGLAEDSLSIGDAVRRLRVEVTGLHQSQFARMCKISVRTLVHIEHGEGNQTLKLTLRELDDYLRSLHDRRRDLPFAFDKINSIKQYLYDHLD